MQTKNPAIDAAQPAPASLGVIPLKAPALPLCIFCPRVNSRMSIGIPQMNKAVAYAAMNHHPPCLNVRYGNFQKLPRPIDDPTAARTKIGLFNHLSRLTFCATS